MDGYSNRYGMTNNAVKEINESESEIEVSIDSSDISDIEKIQIEGIDYEMEKKSKYVNKEINNEDIENKDSKNYYCIFAIIMMILLIVTGILVTSFLISGVPGLIVGSLFSAWLLCGGCYIVYGLLKN